MYIFIICSFNKINQFKNFFYWYRCHTKQITNMIFGSDPETGDCQLFSLGNYQKYLVKRLLSYKLRVNKSRKTLQMIGISYI